MNRELGHFLRELGLVLILVALVAVIVHHFLFVLEEVQVVVSLKDAQQIELGLDDSSCTPVLSAGDADYARFDVDASTPGRFEMHSGLAAITSTLRFTYGALGSSVCRSPGVDCQHADTLVRGTTKDSASGMSQQVEWDGSEGARMTLDVCSQGLSYDTDSGRVQMIDYWAGLEGPNRTTKTHPLSIEVEQYTLTISSPMTVTMVQMADDLGDSPSIGWTFRPDPSRTDSGVSVSSYVEDSSAELVAELPIQLQQAQANDVTVLQPVGKIDIQGQSLQDLDPPIGALDVRRLRLGGPGRMGAHDAHPPFGLFWSESDGYQIVGSSSNITYAGHDLIDSRWDMLPSGLQGTIFTLTAGILIGLIRWAYGSIRSALTHVDPPPIKLPAGHIVLVLATGRALAGAVKQAPSASDHRWILTDARDRDQDGHWHADVRPEVAVEASHVAYTYVESQGRG